MIAPILLCATAPALAAGGGDVVDDSAPETPGMCHFESWGTLAHGGQREVTIAPACTRKAMPGLEIGGFITRAWSGGASASTEIGVAPKLNLRPESLGVGIGIEATAGIGVETGRLESASVTVPVTVPASDWARLNFNLGWQWSRGGRGHRLFAGAQAELKLTPRWQLIVEGFGHDDGKPGGQADLRWNLPGGRGSLDLMAGKRVLDRESLAVTLGVTLRG